MEVFVNNILDRVAEYLEFFLGQGGHIGSLVAVVILILVWLGSGALACSVAERKMRVPFLHFLCGLILPVLYPLAAMVLMTPPKRYLKSEEDVLTEDDLLRIDGPPPVLALGNAKHSKRRSGPNPLHEDTIGTQSSVYDQTYFKNIAFDDAGRTRGPFSLLVEGVELRIERIVDAMPEVVVVETVNADGKQQTLRIPYGKVEFCREI